MFVRERERERERESVCVYSFHSLFAGLRSLYYQTKTLSVLGLNLANICSFPLVICSFMSLHS